MNYLVFESGSRAGFSAKIFFLNYISECYADDDILYMADSNNLWLNVDECHKNIKHISDEEAIDLLLCGKAELFPADELTRQRNTELFSKDKFGANAFVKKEWYDKKATNIELSKILENSKCNIRIPQTFVLDDICAKPNKLSAGSKGIMMFNDYCVSQRIDIAEEYVVDIFRESDNEIEMVARQVVLRGGYDALVKILSNNDALCKEVRKFILLVSPENEGRFSNIFHLQIAKDTNGDLYYIESSKRISGTSFVNLAVGFNPINFMNGYWCYSSLPEIQRNRWYRVEDILKYISKVI